jgi:serine/threonine-protein kinase
MASQLNWTLGPYRIAREIDRGQFGTVYEATDGEDRQIALKLVPVQGADSDEKVAAERQGAALQQRFGRTYRNLVPDVLDHQRIDPYYAIAMELVSGEPLTAVIKAGRVPAARAATIARAICHFLEKAHEFTTNIDDQSETLIVHGDLKPAHVLLLADGSIRVLDFGIAKALAARKAATTNRWGSVDYASPERLETGRVNEQVDFWSLGVILFEMLAACRPYLHYEHNQSRLETAIRRREPRVRLPLDTDARLTAIVDKLLAPQIDRRYQSASQIVKDLDAFLSGAPVAAAAESAKADQPTVRIPPLPESIPRGATSVATEPLPTLHGPVAGLEPPARSPVVETEPMPRPGTPPLPPPPIPPATAAAAAATPAAVAAGLLNRSGVAALLSLILPGLGQIYNGDFLRGIFWLVVTPGFWVGSAGTFGWPFHLISSYTAYKRAQRPAASRPAPGPVSGSLLRRRAPVLLLFLAAALAGTEARALVRAQQLREQVPSVDVGDIGSLREAYRRVGRTPLGLGAALISEPLKARLVELADRTILEFRSELPALTRTDWEHARNSLELAFEIAPSDERVAAKRQYVLGRLAWMGATTRDGIDRSIRLLRDSARLDESSPDPYLGLAAIHAYSTRDLPALKAAINSAEARGYRRGRRERAELGDLHKVLGDRARLAARRLPREEQMTGLRDARQSYADCVTELDGLNLGTSERTLGECRRRLESLTEELDREDPEREFQFTFRLPV